MSFIQLSHKQFSKQFADLIAQNQPIQALAPIGLQKHPCQKAKRWVIKVGSSLLTQNGQCLDIAFMQNLVNQMHYLYAQGIELILVTSGAIAQGMQQLGWKKRPKTTHELQAAAAIGQMGLTQAYQHFFIKHHIITAQILLTHDDLASRERYLNARETLETLLKLRTLPIINENDTVITQEIKFGDNDRLGALVANLVDADVLVLLTDQDAMYTANPTSNPSADKIAIACGLDSTLMKMAGGSDSLVGTGGMQSKVLAAKQAASFGVPTVIAGGKVENILAKLCLNSAWLEGTVLYAQQNRLSARKQWMFDHVQLQGAVHIDFGAWQALKQGKSLLPIGVDGAQGYFKRGDIIACMYNGKEVARGLTQYGSDEMRLILKRNSDAIIEKLGYLPSEELIHRNDLILI